MLKFSGFSIIVVGICGLQLVSSLLFKYDIEFLTDKLFTPCENYPDSIIEHFADMSKLEFINNDDGSVTIEGEIELIHDFQNQEYNATIEFFKRERGAWQKTLYSIKRDDVCTGLFRPNEIWSPYLRQVPEEQRICPFAKGMKYNLSVSTKDPMEFPDRNMAGEYNIRYEGGNSNEPSDFLCINSFVNLYRH